MMLLNPISMIKNKFKILNCEILNNSQIKVKSALVLKIKRVKRVKRNV